LAREQALHEARIFRGYTSSVAGLVGMVLFGGRDDISLIIGDEEFCVGNCWGTAWNVVSQISSSCGDDELEAGRTIPLQAFETLVAGQGIMLDFPIGFSSDGDPTSSVKRWNISLDVQRIAELLHKTRLSMK
jgi:hypothetical protein